MYTEKDLNEYFENHEVELKRRDGKCYHCSYKKRCNESVRWNVKRKITSNLNNIFSYCLNLAIDKAPLQVVGAFFRKAVLPCRHTAREIVEAKEEINKALKLLDAESKNVLIGVLLYRMSGESRYIESVTSCYPQYFIPAYAEKGHDEIVVDCGAYIGDTLELYLKYNKPPKKYYMFEPQIKYIDLINATVERCNATSYATVRQMGVWDCNDIVWLAPSIHGGAGGGYLVKRKLKKAVPVPVTSIDEQNIGKVTLIKMDIEGAEMQALLGAKNTIEKFRPNLAVCIYHKTSDLWKILLYLSESYHFKNVKVVHHKGERTVGDTVLYLYD